MFPKQFYILPEELFRLGNSKTAKLTNIRPTDIDVFEVNGILMILANGRGISVFDKVGIDKSPMTGWVWRFSANTQPPVGLKLVQDKPNHFCIAPNHNMPLDKYIGLLAEMALKATRVYKKEGNVI